MTEYKNYTFVGDGQFSMITIKNKGQGPVPKELRGMFTTQYMAQRQIDRYLDEKGKGSSNASSKRTNTG